MFYLSCFSLLVHEGSNYFSYYYGSLRAQVMDQDLILFDTAETKSKKEVSGLSNLQSRYKNTYRIWMQLDRGVQGNNDRLLIGVIDCGLSAPQVQRTVRFFVCMHDSKEEF